MPDATGPDEGDRARVTWIYDGDTLEVEAEGSTFDVRLIGINAPDYGECYFEEGTDYLIGIAKGEMVILEVTGADQFGRTLAYVSLGSGVSINADLVERGMALATTSDPNDPRGVMLLEAEEAAWRDRLGLWGEDACGASNAVAEVRISAVDADPSGPDDQVLDNETVIMVNEGSNRVNLTGWVLRDESSRHRYHFPNGAKLDPGQTLTITSTDPGWDPGGSPVWNNGGDAALLLDEHGRVVDRARY